MPHAAGAAGGTHSKNSFEPKDISKGAFVVADAENLDLVLISSGSELGETLEAAKLLTPKGRTVRVVSMPALGLFEKQPREFQQTIIPETGSKLVAIEAGVPDRWYRTVGKDGLVLGMERFGASAPAKVLAEEIRFHRTAARGKKIESWLKA